MSARRNRNGFSIIEVLIAIGVVAVGILALMAVFITGTRSNQHGVELGKATTFARKIMEGIRNEGMPFNIDAGHVPPRASSGVNDPVGTFRPIDDPPFHDGGSVRIRTRLIEVDEDGNVVELTEDGEPDGPPLYDDDDLRFERSIQIKRASNNPSDYNFDLMQIDVTVRWRGGKTGDGWRRVKISSMLKAS